MQNSGVVRQLQQIEAQITQEHSRSLSLQAIQKITWLNAVYIRSVSSSQVAVCNSLISLMRNSQEVTSGWA